MDHARLKRSAWVFVLCVAVVVVIAIISGRGTRGPDASRVATPTGGKLPPAPSAGPPTAVSRNLPPSIVLSATATVVPEVDDETGELRHIFIADKVMPREQWETDAERPQVLYFLSPSRVIHLVSDTGHFYSPANIPQSGDFRGNLVLTFYDSGSDRAAHIAPDSPDLVLRLEMPEGATFDKTRGEVRGSGPVHMTTPNSGTADLRGRGLYLMFNQVARRIDRLTLDSVETLRLRADESRMASGEKKKPGARKGDRAGDAAPTKPRLTYRIAFQQAVKVQMKGTVGAESETIEADRMEAYVRMDAGPDGPTSNVQRPTSKSDSTPSTMDVGRATLDDPRRAIEITGGGKLVMEPAAPPVEGESMEEYFLRFIGESQPVRATMRRSMRLTAQRLDYLDTGRTVTATGSDAHPLRLDSPELGRLAALRLVLGLDENIGRLEGPGSIQAAEKPERADKEKDKDKVERSLPPGFKIDWSNSVRFAFDTSAEQTDPQLKSITFLGGVRMRHVEPPFSLDAEQVTAHFTPIKGKSQLAMVDAVGDVRVEAQDGAGEADKLWIEFDVASGDDTRPKRLKAEGNAGFVSKEGGIGGDFLDVTFRDSKHTAPRAEGSDSLGKFASDVATVVARGNVRLMRGDLRVTCDRLDADRVAGTATLIGSVVLSREETEKDPFNLNVDRLDVDETKGTAQAPGGGALTFIPAPEKGHENDDPLPITVTWTKRMSYDDASGLVHVVGDVEAIKKQSKTQMQKLRSGELTLEFVGKEATTPEVEGKKKAKKKEEKKGAGDMLTTDFSKRPIKRLVARENVRVEAWELDAKRPGRDLWRFRIEGPRLEYTLADEVARVIGPGKMVVIDFRAKSGAKKAAAPVATTGAQGMAGEFSGPGTTLFTWEKELLYDKPKARMVLEQAVEMTHLPDGDKPTVAMWADRLTADAPDQEKVKVIDIEMGSLSVDFIEALGHVKINHGEEVQITADEFYYAGPTEVVTLKGQPGRPVKVSNIKDLNPMRGRVIRWDLKTGRKEVVEPGT